ncbi:MAG: HNH endonuclease [Desulfobacteraceae bacterium]|nr:HNH endonuclease [Desulfobacteraceae bacterium]
MSTSCILLNGDYSYLCQMDWKKALCLMFSEKAKVLKYSDRLVHGVEKVFRAPAVMVLIKVVRSVYRNRVPFSKRNVLVRDRYTCVYCSSKQKKLTIDHVIPVSRGGKTDFDNCVACCKPCNNLKGARTPHEAGMHLCRRPYQPTISEFIRIRLKQSGAYRYLVELGLY